MIPFEGTGDYSTWNNSISFIHTLTWKLTISWCSLLMLCTTTLLLCTPRTTSWGRFHSQVWSDGDSCLGFATNCFSGASSQD